MDGWNSRPASLRDHSDGWGGEGDIRCGVVGRKEGDIRCGGRSSRAQGGRHSWWERRYSAQEIYRGRGGRAGGRTCLMSGRVSPARRYSAQKIRVREGFGSPALDNPGGRGDLGSPARKFREYGVFREWGGSATPEGWGASVSPVLEDPRGWEGSETPVLEDSGRGGSALKTSEGWGNPGSPARENSGWGDLGFAGVWGNSGSPARVNSGWGDLGFAGDSGSAAGEDGEESEASRLECPNSENDDMQEHVFPEHEDDKSAGRNRTERIQSLQYSLKSAFDDVQADLVRAERKIKELTEVNKRLKGELKRAKEGEVSSKQSLEQTSNKLMKLVERTKILEEKQVELLKKTKEQEESSNKLEEQLKRAVKGEECSKKDLEQTKNKLRELCTTFAAVKEECDKVCDQQRGASQVAMKRKYVLKVLEVNDLLNCSICLEPWAQSGEHTVCSLSCGHFFGKSCITKWILNGERRGSSTCPVCSRRVALNDIRHHYVSQVYEA